MSRTSKAERARILVLTAWYRWAIDLCEQMGKKTETFEGDFQAGYKAAVAELEAVILKRIKERL